MNPVKIKFADIKMTIEKHCFGRFDPGESTRDTTNPCGEVLMYPRFVAFIGRRDPIFCKRAKNGFMAEYDPNQVLLWVISSEIRRRLENKVKDDTDF